ncbi:MAG TPA: BamA/TamA family outer membrane protein [Chitinophagaceae bacterium]|nr:BamA/TamA family outer membrane protein [Chitinophagaceae bacterium]
MRILCKRKKPCLFFLLLIEGFAINGQDFITVQNKVVDAYDVLRNIFGVSKPVNAKPKTTTLSLLPSFSYNPSFGFIIGASLTGGRQLGDPANTEYSTVSMYGSFSTKGMITIQLKHNIFLPENKWNLQGSWQVSHYGLVDYGVGTGNPQYITKGFTLNAYSTKNSDSSFPIIYNYTRLSEKVYKKIGKYLYAGVGVKFDIYRNITDEKQTSTFNTPHQRYSLSHGFDPSKYSANGLIVAVQYNTRDHPIRPYSGFYAELGFQINQEWIGSTKNSVQLQYDLRKYWSLSKKNPEHVIAIWHFASYKLSGELPYLEMPSTASDVDGRSGRGYTFSRFKGPSFAYFETEWRFPITKNKLISGVCFLNFQSAADDLNAKVFEAWEPGAGIGLRILFQKQNKTTLCIDLAKGKYGAQGLFFGLGETF